MAHHDGTRRDPARDDALGPLLYPLDLGDALGPLLDDALGALDAILDDTSALDALDAWLDAPDDSLAWLDTLDDPLDWLDAPGPDVLGLD